MIKIPIRFFIVTFLWSWLFFGIAIFISHKIFQDTISLPFEIIYAIVIIGLFGPGVGSYISIYTLEGREAIKKHFKKFFSLKFGWEVWLTILLGIGIMAFIAWIIPEFIGENRVQMPFSNIYTLPLFFIVLLIYSTFLNGGNEEIGWRGYILPYLENKYGLIIGSLILGIIWSIWHIPMWFIHGMNHMYMNFLAFMFFCIGYSFIFSWIIKISGNRLFSGLVAHGLVNLYFSLFPVVIHEENNPQIRFWIYSIIVFIVGFIIVIIRTLEIRKIALNKTVSSLSAIGNDICIREK